jgi:fatty acid elongase 3
MPNSGQCAGEEFAAVAGICILSSYLLLFLSFYAATYKKPIKGRSRARSVVALKEMASDQVPTVREAARRLSLSSGKGNAYQLPTQSEKTGMTTRSRKA